MAYKVNNGRLYPVEGPKRPRQTDRPSGSGESFKHLLDKTLQETSELKLSAHALRRLDQRNLKLSQKDMEQLKQAVDKAEAKGARESLLLYKDMAFVASIRNRTIITAVGQKDAKENVFTNIDSAVIIDEE